MASETIEEYKSSLADLTFNSKPLINMLTMLAEENANLSAEIVRIIQVHINQAKPSHRLPCLYLIDSIVKNIGTAGNYKSLIAQDIVSIFIAVFEQVDEKTRQSLYKLRQTWSSLFPNTKLYALDLRVQQIDPAWPLVAQPPDSPISSIHVNPRFIRKASESEMTPPTEELSPEDERKRQEEALRQKIAQEERERIAKEERRRIQEEERVKQEAERTLRQQLLNKKQELMKIQQAQLELELFQAKAKLEQQTKQLQGVKAHSREHLLIKSANMSEEMMTRGALSAAKPDPPKPRDPRTVNRDPRRGAREPNETTTPPKPTDKSDEPASRPAATKSNDAESNKSVSKDPSPKRETIRSSKDAPSQKSYTKRKAEGRAPAAPSGPKKDHRSAKGKDEGAARRSPGSDRKSGPGRESHQHSKDKTDRSGGRRQYRTNKRSESPSDGPAHSQSNNKRSRSRSPHRRSPRSERSPRNDPSHDEDSRDSFKRRPRDKSAKVAGENSDRPLPRNFARRGGNAARLGRDAPSGAQRRDDATKLGQENLPEEEAAPPHKKARPGGSRKKGQPMEEDGTENSYRKLPPIPKLTISQKAEQGRYPMASPSAEGWAKFKVSRPDDFPYAHNTPMLSPTSSGGGAPFPRRTLLSSPDSLLPGGSKPHLLDAAGDILIQADEQLRSGKLTTEQHSDLLTQLTELAKLQKVKEHLQEERAKTVVEEVERPDTKAKAAKEAYEEHATRLRAALQTTAGRPMGPGGRGSRALLPTPMDPRDPREMRGGRGGGSFGPRGPRDGPIRGPPPRGMDGHPRGGPHYGPRGPREPYRHAHPYSGVGINRPMDCWEPLQYPWYDTEDFYVAEHDPRWLFKAKRYEEGRYDIHELVVDGCHYEIPLNKPIKVRLNEQTVSIHIDPETQEVFFGANCYYKIGDFERTFVMNGEQHTVFLLGPLKNVWIDGHKYEINLDSPPTKIRVHDKEHDVRIDSFTRRLYVDGFDICPYGDEPQSVKLAFVEHDIQFQPPPRHILIDENLCELNLAARYPYVNIDGKRYGIRFDGPPREILIDDKPWTVRVDEPRKCRFSGQKPRLLALGGPGHELIIDNNTYELKFGGADKYVRCGDREHKVQLMGSAPEVKILGQMKTIDEIYDIAGPPPLDYVSAEGRRLGFAEPRGPHMRYPHPPRHPMRPGGMGPRQGPMGPRDPRFGPRGPPGPMRPPRMAPPIPPPHHMGGQPDMMRGPPMDYQPQPPRPQQPAAVPKVDVSDLLSKLMFAGLIGTKEENTGTNEPEKTVTDVKVEKSYPEKEVKVEEEEDDENLTEAQKLAKEAKIEERNMDPLPSIEFLPKKLKVRALGVIQRVYVGVQCSSCGTRFTTEHIDKYQEHLDWHFRQNRREKDEIKVAKYRRWYYGVADWIQYEEISHKEDTQSNFFDTMFQSEFSYTPEVPAEMISCPTASENKNDDTCDVCREKFEQFFDEEREEWHLKDAIRVKNKTYHPMCFEDVKDTPQGPTPVQTPTPSDTDLIDPITNPLAYLNQLNAMRDKESSTPNSPSKSDNAPAQTEETQGKDTETPPEKAQTSDVQNGSGESVKSTDQSTPDGDINSIDTGECSTASPDKQSADMHVEPQLIVVQPIKSEPGDGNHNVETAKDSTDAAEIDTTPSQSDSTTLEQPAE